MNFTMKAKQYNFELSTHKYIFFNDFSSRLIVDPNDF